MGGGGDGVELCAHTDVVEVVRRVVENVLHVPIMRDHRRTARRLSTDDVRRSSTFAQRCDHPHPTPRFHR